MQNDDIPGAGKPPGIDPHEYEAFRRQVLALLHVDLDQYKREQLLRRLVGLRERLKFRHLSDYAQQLTHDPAELERFRRWFTINVTEFFRDPDRWSCLRDQILPSLLLERRSLRIWSAGCSHGAEVYSLAILLAQYRTSGPHYVLATDIDPSALAIAAAGGPYSPSYLANVSPSQLTAYFTREKNRDDQWSIHRDLRTQIVFREADLMREPPDRDFDLVICRNVVIYFTEDAKAQVLRNFDRALRPGGVLFTGATELIPRANPYGLVLEQPSFYRRHATTRA